MHQAETAASDGSRVAPSPAIFRTDQRLNYLRIGEVARVVGGSPGTLRRWEHSGRVVFERIDNQRVLARDQLEPFLAALDRPSEPLRAPNHLPGVVVSVECDLVVAKVEIACGDFRVVSLVDRGVVEELELGPGAAVTAVLTANHVTLENTRVTFG